LGENKMVIYMMNENKMRIEKRKGKNHQKKEGKK
jgi:hypothetical protein